MSEQLQLTSLCNRISVPAISQPQFAYILSELKPGPHISQTCLPLNLAIVVVLSEAMKRDHLEALKGAFKMLIDRLGPRDVLSVIASGDKVQTLISAQKVENKSKLKRSLDRIKDASQGDIASGLGAGLKQINHWCQPGRVSRILLIVAETIENDGEGSRKLADDLGAMGVPIIGLGIGRSWDEELLIDLADRSVLAAPGSGTGRVDYILTAEGIDQAFEHVYQSLQVAAQSVSIIIRMMRGVQIQQLWQVKPFIGDISLEACEEQTIRISVGDLERWGAAYLAEVLVPSRAAGSVRIAQTEVNYQLPDLGAQREMVDLVVDFSQDMAVTNPLDSYVMDYVEMAQIHRLGHQALADVENGDKKSATEKLRQASAIWIAQGEADLADQMRAEADYYLRQFGQISGEGRKAIRLLSRKSIKSANLED